MGQNSSRHETVNANRGVSLKMSSMERVEQIFEKFHRFDDGLILSFEYFYIPNEKLAAQMIFYARDHSLDGNIWRKVRVVVRDVEELCMKVRGDQFNSICSGVKLLRFDGVWCVDIDGVYGVDGEPRSLDEVREDGECYVIGGWVEACEIFE